MDYKDYPKSINEVKAGKAEDAGLWTPRDALISALRDIDNGTIKPTYLYIVAANATEATTEFDYYRCMPNACYGIGMLTKAINSMI